MLYSTHVVLVMTVVCFLAACPFIYIFNVDVTYSGVSDLMWAAVAVAAMLLYIRALHKLFPRAMESLGWKMEMILGRVTIPMSILIALSSGISEEVIFRGFLQPKIGIVLASVIFGLIHWMKGSRIWSVFAIGAGFILGGVTIASGSLVPAMIAHAVNNFISCLLLRRSIDRKMEIAAEATADDLPADLKAAEAKLREVNQQIEELRRRHAPALE